MITDVNALELLPEEDTGANVVCDPTCIFSYVTLICGPQAIEE